MSQRELRSCARSFTPLYPHRLLRLELRELEGRVLRRRARTPVAPALCAALRHRRGEHHLLSTSTEIVGRGVGRADATGLPLHGESVALPDAHQTAHGSRCGDQAVLRADRAARRVTEARSGAVAAAGDLSPERRPARSCARGASAGAALLRVPARKLVRGTRLRPPPISRRSTRHRRPSGGKGVPEARVHDRLDVRAVPLRVEGPAGKLLGT